MGLPMARRLCEAGYSVQAYNRSIEKAQALVPFGAVVQPRLPKPWRMPRWSSAC